MAAVAQYWYSFQCVLQYLWNIKLTVMIFDAEVLLKLKGLLILDGTSNAEVTDEAMRVLVVFSCFVMGLFMWNFTLMQSRHCFCDFIVFYCWNTFKNLKITRRNCKNNKYILKIRLPRCWTVVYLFFFHFFSQMAIRTYSTHFPALSFGNSHGFKAF